MCCISIDKIRFRNWSPFWFSFSFFFCFLSTNWKFNCKRTQITTNLGEQAQPEWKPWNNAHLCPNLPCTTKLHRVTVKSLNPPSEIEFVKNVMVGHIRVNVPELDVTEPFKCFVQRLQHRFPWAEMFFFFAVKSCQMMLATYWHPCWAWG